MRLKPSHPRLRHDHPLASGLVGAWVGAEGSGRTAIDSSGAGSHLQGSTFSSWENGRYGSEFAGRASQAHLWAATLPAVQRVQNATLYWAGSLFPGSSASGNPRIFILDHNQANIPPFVCLGFYRTNDTTIGAAWNNGSFQVKSLATTATEQLSLAITHTPGSVVVYKNGLQIDSSATAGTISYASDALIRTGTQVSTNPQSSTSCGLLFNRVLPATELLELHADPFAMFRPRQRSYFALAGEAGPPTGSGTVSAVGTLTGTGSTAKSGSGSVVGVGALVGAGTAVQSGTGTISAVGTLVGTGESPTVAATGSGIVSGIGELVGTGLSIQSGSGFVSGIGTIVGTGFAPVVGTATGFGQVVSVGEIIGVGSVIRSGSGSVTSVGELVGVGPIVVSDAYFYYYWMR